MRHYLCWKTGGEIFGFDIALGKGIAVVIAPYEKTFLRMRVMEKFMAYSRAELQVFFSKKVQLLTPQSYEEKMDLIPNSHKLWHWDWDRVDECRFLDMKDPKFPPNEYRDHFLIFDFDTDRFVINDGGETILDVSLGKGSEAFDNVTQLWRKYIVQAVLDLYFKEYVDWFSENVGYYEYNTQNPHSSLEISFPSLTVKIPPSLFFKYEEMRMSVENQLGKLRGDFGDASVASERSL